MALVLPVLENCRLDVAAAVGRDLLLGRRKEVLQSQAAQGQSRSPSSSPGLSWRLLLAEPGAAA